MSKYIRIFFFTVLVSAILFFLFRSVLMGGGNPAEEAVYTIGTILIILLSFLISQIYYVIHLIQKKR
ncbi:hypothetical protein [Peribacillus acanthi]|uniref:hypothetical protein n=1 Tax=Peribacillus acanthi TaxID=2171554 RepID=UPI000D3E6349|nr:hypothetical protein [Peribacillus acanthi]